jgi:hypothetical protein
MTEQTPQEQKTMTEPSRTEQSATNGKTTTVNLPFVTAQFRRPEIHLPGRRPHLHVPGRQQVRTTATAVKGNLPSTTQVLYYGGLGALAVGGMIDWPVALAVGAGTLVAQRARRGHEPETAGMPQGSEQPGTPESAGKSTTE